MSTQMKFRTAAVSAAIGFGLTAATLAQAARPIIQDAEHYPLAAQHAEKWAEEDKALDKRLAELRKKHGTRPNIIHIMWDDMALGEVGIPEI